MSLLFFLCLGNNLKTFAQSHEAKQLLLDVEKLASLKNILTDLKKGYVVVSEGYNTIRNISEGNFNLHETFLNSLVQISPTVRNYKRIADIINAQVKIVSEYKTAFKNFRASNLFNPDEIQYLGKVYSNLFDQSVKNLDDLAMVITAGKLRMSDDERLSAIHEIWKKVNGEWIFLRHFNNSTKILALQRAKEQHDVSIMSRLYDVNH
jgi:hypothetical protein